MRGLLRHYRAVQAQPVILPAPQIPWLPAPQVPAVVRRFGRSLPAPQMPIAEMSNPGPVGQDTGYTFTSPRTGQEVRVIAHIGESRSDAIGRVKARHGA